MNEYALTGTQSCAAAAAAGETLQMDEQRFAAFYERTARPLWAFLCHVTGDRTAADDLTQETYYRFLRARLPEMGEAERKAYLFRIASNLVRDEWRKRQAAPAVVPVEPETKAAGGDDAAGRLARESELALAMKRISPRERQLLWLAYVEGSSHKEIAELSGMRPGSVRPMLFRARRKLASLLRGLRAPKSGRRP